MTLKPLVSLPYAVCESRVASDHLMTTELTKSRLEGPRGAAGTIAVKAVIVFD